MIVPGPLLERVLPGGLAPEQRRLEVDLERLVVPAGIDAERRTEVRIGRRVVDQDVQATEPFDGGRDRPLARIVVAGVAGEHVDLTGHLRRRGLELILLAAVEHHLGAGCRERGGDRLADALRCAGDECDLAVQSEISMGGDASDQSCVWRNPAGGGPCQCSAASSSSSRARMTSASSGSA